MTPVGSRAKAAPGRRAARDEQRPDERILSLLMMLLDADRPVSRAEIFDAIPAYRTKNPSAGERKFERDKKDLREIGVPLADSDDEANAYQVDRRAYELPPVSLDDDERIALMMAADALRSDGMGYRDLVEDALRKLSFDAGVSGRPFVPAHMAVSLTVHGQGARLRRHVAALARAAQFRKRVTITYGSPEGSTHRDVNPYALVFTGGDWQLIGHCHLRNAPRTFRVDRVARMKVAGRPGTPDFERPPGFSVVTYVQRSPWVFQAGAAGDAVDVVLDIGPERAWIAEEDFGPGATREPHDDGWTKVTFRTGNPHYVVTRVLDAVGHIRLLAPAPLRSRVHQIATDVAALYPS